MIGLIDRGLVPFAYAEGGYNSRLEIIRDLPRGKVIWAFDGTDMSRAKAMLGDVSHRWQHAFGGVEPRESRGSKQITRKLIDTAGKGGGYIMTNGAVIEEAKPENIRAWIDFTKKYGVY